MVSVASSSTLFIPADALISLNMIGGAGEDVRPSGRGSWAPDENKHFQRVAVTSFWLP